MNMNVTIDEAIFNTHTAAPACIKLVEGATSTGAWRLVTCTSDRLFNSAVVFIVCFVIVMCLRTERCPGHRERQYRSSVRVRPYQAGVGSLIGIGATSRRIDEWLLASRILEMRTLQPPHHRFVWRWKQADDFHRSRCASLQRFFRVLVNAGGKTATH